MASAEPTDEVRGPGATAWVAIENHPQLAEVVADLEPPPRAHDDETHLDMNALIDVCLVLLIFFMMTTTYAVAVQKMVPLPPCIEEEHSKKSNRFLWTESCSAMVRIDLKPDAKGKPLILVEGLRLDVLNADDSLDHDKLREELLKFTRGVPKREEVLLDARGVTWGLVIVGAAQPLHEVAPAAVPRLLHRPQHRVERRRWLSARR